MIVLYVLIALALAISIAFAVLVAPGKKKDIDKYKGINFAHRGLHDEDKVENSMSAFKAAVDAGYGIEMDIRLSSDGKLVVFHDDTLSRVVGIDGKVDEYTAEELGKMKLLASDDGVPLFEDVLKMVDGKVPLLVEMKEASGQYGVSNAAAEVLKGYKGPYIVESFNPLSLANFSKKMPDVACGILSYRYYEEEKYRKPLFLALQLLLLNRLCNPSFISYDHRHANSIGLRLARLLGAATVAWTVRSLDEADVAKKNKFDSIIFENYLP